MSVDVPPESMQHFIAQSLDEQPEAKLSAGTRITWTWKICIATALLLQACFGVPFPANLGWVEYGIGALLLAAVVFCRIDFRRNVPLQWFQIIAVAWLLVIPGLTGYENEMRRITRDVIPIFFWLIPLLFLPLASGRSREIRWLPELIGVCGGLLALRNLLALHWSVLHPYNELPFVDDWPVMLAISYDPCIHFASIYAFCTIMLVSRSTNPPNLLRCGIAVIVLLLTVLSQISWSQRLPLIFLVIAGVTVAIQHRRSLNRRTTAWLAGILAIGVVALGHHLMMAVGSMLEKQAGSMSGMNGKELELMAVLEAVTVDPMRILFGYGWGALYADPIFLGQKASFTHSAITFLLIKSGLLGLGAAAVVAYSLLRRRIVEMPLHPAVLASVSPLLMGMLTQATYKTHTFGWMLLVLIAASAWKWDDWDTGRKDSGRKTSTAP